MRHLLTACALPWLIGLAIWLSGPAPYVAAGLAALAVIFAMSLAEVSRAETKNTER